MLESEVKKLRESVDQNTDALVALKEALTKGNLPTVEIEDPPGTHADNVTKMPEAPATMAPEEVNAKLGPIAMQMGDNGLAIRNMLETNYGSTSLKMIDPALYPALIQAAESLVNPKEVA